MAKAMLALLLLAFLLFCPHGAAGAKGSFFRLKRRYGRPKPSFHQGHLLAHLQVHDKLRHSRLLASAETFPLGGTADPFMAGLYFTEVQLGSPPSKYYVQVDTGSDLLWLNCASCRTCPTSTDLGVHLALYDPQKSSSSSILLCGDVYCDAISEQVCQTGQLCSYELGYGDGSSSQGYYVRDTFHPNIVAGDYSVKMGNASVTFGCGIIQGGDLRQQDQALDGIIGFGQSTNSSVVLQLANQKQAPAVFAHCLEGEGDGGGMLVIGKVQVKGLVYTPIVPNQPHYNVNLKSIAVNGVTIPVDSSVSGSSQRAGTIIDSGTTLAYFATAAYEQLLAAILQALPSNAQNYLWQGMTCILTGSVHDFPTVTLSFEGKGAILVVRPQQYLIQADGNGAQGWCIGFQNHDQSSLDLTILGDLILKDRLVVYDLEQQRIGWVDYNCSSNVSVLSPTGQVQHVQAMIIPSVGHASIIAVRKCGLLHAIALLYLWLISGITF